MNDNQKHQMLSDLSIYEKKHYIKNENGEHTFKATFWERDSFPNTISIIFA